MRILLADDQDEIRLLTTLQLEKNGHYVVAVGNGKEVLEVLGREVFDVVLLDEDMPVMSGIQALRAIRERQKEFPPMMVVALTGYNSDPDRDRLLQAGFDSVIGKPFRLDALESLLRGATTAETAKSKKDVSSAGKSPYDNVLERVGGDEKLARRMITTFLRDTPKRLTGIQVALRKNNGQVLASLAHAIKGSVAIFGADAAHDCSLKLQDQGRANDFGGLSAVYDQLKEEIAKLEANLRGYAEQKRSPSPGASPESKRRSSRPKR